MTAAHLALTGTVRWLAAARLASERGIRRHIGGCCHRGWDVIFFILSIRHSKPWKTLSALFEPGWVPVWLRVSDWTWASHVCGAVLMFKVVEAPLLRWSMMGLRGRNHRSRFGEDGWICEACYFTSGYGWRPYCWGVMMLLRQHWRHFYRWYLASILRFLAGTVVPTAQALLWVAIGGYWCHWTFLRLSWPSWPCTDAFLTKTHGCSTHVSKTILASTVSTTSHGVL